MRLARLFCFLMIFGISAIAAHAQTPVDPGSVVNDPKANFSIPPDCTYPYCLSFTYSGSPVLPFTFTTFNLLSPVVSGETISCGVTNSEALTPIACLAFQIDNGTMWDIQLIVFNLDAYLNPDGDAFSAGLTAAGGTITITSVTGPAGAEDLPCTNCGTGPMTVDPVPEPATGFLFGSGLLLVSIAGIARRRFRAISLS